MVKVRGRNSNRKTVKQTAENGQKSRVTTPRGRHESLVPGTSTSRLRISRVTLHDCEVAPVWHHDVTNARTCQFFRRLFDRLPVRISTSDLYHRILRKKIYHIRAYGFGVQFSFNGEQHDRRRRQRKRPQRVKGGTRNNHDEVKGGTRNNHNE